MKRSMSISCISTNYISMSYGIVKISASKIDTFTLEATIFIGATSFLYFIRKMF